MPGNIQVGDCLADRFEVFEIHQGGMGVVYSARDRRATPGREFVALKTLRNELLVDRERGDRFAAECHLWVHLGQHPNVVRAYAVEELEGKPHIILELVSGGELKGRIGTPQLDLPKALRYGVEFCLGMEHAIRQGLRCHRDIKPANLLLSATGTLKITDFGLAGIRDELLAAGLDGPDDPIALVDSPHQAIQWTDPRDRIAQVSPHEVAKVQPEESPVDLTTETVITPVVPFSAVAESGATVEYTPPKDWDGHDTLIWHLTRTGALLGTLPYMAPEQFSDPRFVDVRVDIYSFGVVLFEILTNTLPFRGTTVAKIERQHARYNPPSVIPSIPRKFAREAEAVDKIVQRCLAKAPENRFETIPDLRRSLTHVLRRLGLA